MSKRRRENLVEVKRALAKKYENLARKAKSRPKRRTFLYHAEKCRRQARDLSRDVGGAAPHARNLP